MKEKTTAIVLAAGQGKRMHSKIQKQFLEIQDHPVLYYSLRCFQDSSLIDDIILVTGNDMISYCKNEIVDHYSFTKVSNVIAGGKERYDSVYQGLLACAGTDYVFIHDGARPFITEEILKRGLSGVRETGACVVGMPSKDTIKVVDQENYAVRTPERKTLWQVQTPQCFEFDLVKKAYEKMMENDDGKATDDAMVVETYGNVPVKLFEGGYDNIKVTTPEDVRLATNLVRVRKLFHKLHMLHDKLIYMQMKAYKKRFKEKKQKK